MTLLGALLVPALLGFLAVLALAIVAWGVSRVVGKVCVVDSFWPLFFVVACVAYMASTPGTTNWSWWVLGLVLLWAVRLSVYLSWRSWGSPEDRRYQAIRERHEPGFHWKSLFLVFGLQAVLAWVVSFPLLAAVAQPPSHAWLAVAGSAVVLFGIAFESIADWQLARFRRRNPSPDEVFDQGLWALSRHPNYFGEACVWWGFFLIAGSAGGAWTLLSPLLMTWLLLRVSGVALLEDNLKVRKRAYADYCRRVPAFVPRLFRSKPNPLPCLLTLSYLASAAVAAAEPPTRKWEFDVSLDGSPIGTHRFELRENAPGEQVLVSEANFEVKFWVVPVYRYRHRAVEQWRNGCLDSLQADTEENGKRSSVRAYRLQDHLIVERPPRDSLRLAGCVWTFAYWNPGIIHREQLLNPQTGEWIPVRLVEEANTIALNTNGRPDLRTFALLGPDFRIGLAYTQTWDWVLLEAEPRPGRKLVYNRR